jgi:hypothetical protein
MRQNIIEMPVMKSANTANFWLKIHLQMKAGLDSYERASHQTPTIG